MKLKFLREFGLHTNFWEFLWECLCENLFLNLFQLNNRYQGYLRKKIEQFLGLFLDHYCTYLVESNQMKHVIFFGFIQIVVV
jgi:hypothetical protein